MTKFDIFVVNLERSVDRREAMREKIKRIRGFEKIYIDDEMVVDFTDSADLQNPNQNNPRVSANLESRPLRGAKNRIQGCRSATADFLLEAEKRGTPPKSEKRSFWRVGGAGRGVQPFCEKESNNSKSNLDSIDLRNSADKSALESPNRLSRVSFEGGGGGLNCEVAPLAPPSQLPPPPPTTLLSGCADAQLNFTDSAFCAESTLHFHFFEATDATDFKNGESPLPPQYSSKLTRFVKGKDLSFGEMACFSSHYRLWQKCVALDSPIIILEDDIDFMQDFCQIVEIFKSPFEYVRLRYTIDKKITHLYDNFYISFDRTAGTQGYYLTPQAAQKFIKNARFWLFCVDDYMDMFFIHSVKNIIFKPFIISEDLHSATQSTILGREKPQMRFYQKLTRELSRIYFFVIRKYLYFALHCVELRAFFRAHKSSALEK